MLDESTQVGGPRPSLRESSLKAALSLIFAALVVDLLTQYNLGIIYPLAVLLCAWTGRRRLVWGLAWALLVLVYAGYFLGPHTLAGTYPAGKADLIDMLNFRLVNRTIAAVAILAAGVFGSCWMSQCSPKPLDVGGDATGAADVHEEARIVYWFHRAGTSFLCLLLIVGVLATDLAAPVRYNLPILYTLPLLVCIVRNDRQLLWIMLPLLLTLTAAGYMVDPREMDYPLIHVVLRNRMLAAGVMVGVTALGHLWLAASDPVPRSSSEQPALA
jgi:hypothetical protein